MKLFKTFIIVLIAIVVLGGIVDYFLPNQFSVSTSIEINKPADVIYAQIYDFNKWGTWDPWAQVDSAAKTTVEGAPGTPGQKMSWSGKKLGTGSMTLKSTGANQFVYSEVEFVKPFKASIKDMIRLEASGDKTKVTWTTRGGLAFPFGRLFGLTVNKMMGKDQMKGLENLKKYTESLPAAPAPVVDTGATAVMAKMPL